LQSIFFFVKPSFINLEDAVLPSVPFAVVHDDSFVPDAVLRVTEEEYQQPCVSKKNVVLVNGTSPGPDLTFTEGETVWIRVYNDMDTQNLTMVSFWHPPFCF
jgi:hypothetical protein